MSDKIKWWILFICCLPYVLKIFFRRNRYGVSHPIELFAGVPTWVVKMHIFSRDDHEDLLHSGDDALLDLLYISRQAQIEINRRYKK